MGFFSCGVLKALCSGVLCLVVLQLVWLHQSRLVSSFLLFHHQSYPIDNVYCHGKPKCLSSEWDLSTLDVKYHADFCRQRIDNIPERHDRLATVTAHFGTPQTHYQRALRTHSLHNAIHETGIHVLATMLIDDLWNKPAFILDLLLSEMEKPEVERLEWLFWVDRDTIILDTCRSPLGFLPIPMQQINGSDTQRDPAENINLLATKDWNGLNNGVFLMRVNRWSVDLFSAILALRHYRPDADLPFTEQSAMEILLNEAPFNKNVIWVPQWWFNAYGRGKDKEDFKPLTTDPNSQLYHARRGDFLVHFAGTGSRDQAMAPWLDHAENATLGWALETKERDLDSETSEFWKIWRNNTIT